MYWFKVYDTNSRTFYSNERAKSYVESLGLKFVPVLDNSKSVLDVTKQELLESADGKSTLNSNTNREGLVFRSNDEKFQLSFKAISNVWLLKNED